MTINDLMQHLQNCLDEGMSGDTKVQMVYQPNYPLLSHVGGIATSKMIAESEAERHHERYGATEADEGCDDVAQTEDVVFLVEGGNIGYGSKHAWEVAQ